MPLARLEQKAREEDLWRQKELRRAQLALEGKWQWCVCPAWFSRPLFFSLRAEVQGEVERLKDCLHESLAECSSLQGQLCAAAEQQGELARQYDSVQKRLVCLGDSPEASMRELQQQVETLRAQLKSTEQHSQRREEGGWGWGGDR